MSENTKYYCDRCNKEIDNSFIYISEIDHKYLCNDCFKKEQPKELAKQIDQLKQQLEESFTEEDVESLIEDREKTIKFLQQQFAEKDEELRKYKSYKTDDERIKDLTNLYSQYKEENNQLRKELKDKDFALECKERDIKAIEKQRDKAYDDYGYLDKISRELGLQNVDYEKQIALLKSSEKCLTERIKNQNQFAINELEKVKEYNAQRIYGNDLVDKFIDKRINELKGEKNEHK